MHVLMFIQTGKTSNGFDDWYLPSKDELEQFPSIITDHGYYWSSSYAGEDYWGGVAWCLKNGKFNKLELSETVPKIWPIRQF